MTSLTPAPVQAEVRLQSKPVPSVLSAFANYLQTHGLSVLGDFSWTLLGNGVFAASQWGIIIVLAKLVNPEAIGHYSLSQAIVTPVLMLAAFQLRGVVASDVHNEFTNREYFGFRIISLAIGFLAAFVIAFFSVKTSSQLQLVCLVGLIQCAELISDTLYGFRQRDGDLVRPARSMVMKSILGLAALASGIYLGHSVLIGFIALLATRATVLVVYDVHRSLGVRDPVLGLGRYFDWSRHRGLFKVVCYVGIMAMLSAWIGMIPRYFVEAYLGSRDLGVFTAIYSLTTFGLMPITALGMAVFVRLARTFHYGPSEQFFQLLGMLFGLSFLIGLGGLFLSYVAGPQILTILFRPQYAAYVEIFQLTMMVGAVLFLAAALGASLTAARVFKPQVKLLAIVAIVQALGCWILTPRLGLKGAVIACLIAAVAQFAGTGLILAVQWARRTPVACAPVSVS